MAVGFFVPHACASFTMKALAAAAALGQHGYVMAVATAAASARREAML